MIKVFCEEFNIFSDMGMVLIRNKAGGGTNLKNHLPNTPYGRAVRGDCALRPVRRKIYQDHIIGGQKMRHDIGRISWLLLDLSVRRQYSG
jgi:hypothetical protein